MGTRPFGAPFPPSDRPFPTLRNSVEGQSLQLMTAPGMGKGGGRMDGSKEITLPFDQQFALLFIHVTVRYRFILGEHCSTQGRLARPPRGGSSPRPFVLFRAVGAVLGGSVPRWW